MLLLSAAFTGKAGNLPLIVDSRPAVVIVVGEKESSAVKIAAANLAQDFERVCGTTATVVDRAAPGSAAISVRVVPDGRWEAYTMTVAPDGVEIAGSDRRGAVYGIYELSRRLGVSPWYWWADAPTRHRDNFALECGVYSEGEPKVKYRGIFINDEWPSFGGWTSKKFGGFNSKMYAHLFELLLRLKANYLWPAMWSGAFGEDDPENQRLAEEYGIVMGTSHHEPMMRAHKEYTHARDKVGAWNYETNKAGLDRFFREGAERAKGRESVFTLGMRGDGDVAMDDDDERVMATLKRVIDGQRGIIADVYGAPDAVPQLWAIFTEVQRYYDRGFTVPDDVTLLFCDNNWGYLRRTGTPEMKARKGGAGLYYHIDMNGGPWNDRWVNTTTVPKLREQFNLAYRTGLDRIWIVNVGDLKPKEVPIDFIMKYAWNPDAIGPGGEMKYLEDFAASIFGREHAKEIAAVIAGYSDLNLRRKPEVQAIGLYDEAEYAALDKVWSEIVRRAEALKRKIPADAQDAFYELVYYPAVASAGVAQMYIAASLGDSNRVDRLYTRDRELEKYYNEKLTGGKWNGMMKDVHMGYVKWSMPEKNEKVKVKNEKVVAKRCDVVKLERGITESKEQHGNEWVSLPGVGNCGVSYGAKNVAAKSCEAGKGPTLEYRVKTVKSGVVKLAIGILPTQDVNPKRGLRLGVRLDGGETRVLDARQGMADEFCEYTPKALAKNPILKKIPPRSKNPLARSDQKMHNEIFDNVRWLDAEFADIPVGSHSVELVMIDPEVVVEGVFLIGGK